MMINNSIVKKIVQKEKDSDEIKFIRYEYFACTCKEPDVNFHNSLIEIFYPEANKEENRNRRTTYFAKELRKLGWKYRGCGADMWMGASFTKDATESSPNLAMYIQCDALEYGISTALIIAKNIEKEQK